MRANGNGNGSPHEAPGGRGRLGALAVLMVVGFVVLSVRLYDLQIAQGARYRELSEQNRLVRLPVLAERGIVYDRNGVVLARNIPGFLVKVLPADLPEREQAAVADRLAALLGIPAQDVVERVEAGRRRSPYEPVAVTRTPVTRELALLVDERGAELPGVRIEAESVRQYVDGPLYSPVLGYLGPVSEDELTELRARGYLPDDLIGRTGIERTYEHFLRGTYGVREVERDAAQREIRVLAERPSVPGANLVLSIDDRLQRIVAAELHQAILEKKMRAAVGIAMNPQNGEILALVSIPSYDNNVFIRGVTPPEMRALNADPGRPLVNKAIGDAFPPGSTFKLVTGLAALNEGVATRSTVVNVSSNVITVEGWNYYDWRAHGAINFVDGFAHSSDIYFYTMGGGNPYTGQRGVGGERLSRYAKMLGFGSPTGIDVPGEAAGLAPDPEWKRRTLGEEWTLGNTYHASIGQGYVAVTPLQLLQAYAAVANGGTLFRPHVVREVVDARGEAVQRVGPEALRRLEIRPEHLRLMREAMRKVVTVGHAWMPGHTLPISGKTGTAEFGESYIDALGQRAFPYHNWFVSFLPKDESWEPNADIAMVIFAYDASFNCRAAFCANPAIAITQRVYETYVGGDGQRKQARTP